MAPTHSPARPLIVAHRGCSHRAPENTLASYRLALKTGAEMAECDVHVSADGVVMLLHDDTLDRTTNGSGPMSAKTAAELKTLDAGSWKDPQYAGERIPTLVEALKLVHGKLRFVIEIKGTGMGQPVVDAIQEAGVKPTEVMVISFYHAALVSILAIEPTLPSAWLLDALPPAPADRAQLLQHGLDLGIVGIGLSRKRVDEDFVRMAHVMGLKVFVYTVNDPDEMRRIAAMGVDALISDRPDLAIKTLEP